METHMQTTAKKKKKKQRIATRREKNNRHLLNTLLSLVIIIWSAHSALSVDSGSCKKCYVIWNEWLNTKEMTPSQNPPE